MMATGAKRLVVEEVQREMRVIVNSRNWLRTTILDVPRLVLGQKSAVEKGHFLRANK